MTVKINRFWDRLTTPHSPAPPARPVAHAHCGDTERLDPHTPKAGSQSICRCRSRPSTGSQLISRPPKHSGSPSRLFLLARADGVIESIDPRRLLRCRSLLVAHRVDSLRCEGSDAIGAKRTCRERRERVDLTKMTRCGSWAADFAATYKPLIQGCGRV
jgi:hypothetical protein